MDNSFHRLRLPRWVALVALLSSLLMANPLYAAPANLEVSLTDNRATAVAGDELTYTIRVTNVTGTDLTGVSVDVLLPNEVTFVDASAVYSTPGPEANRYRFDLGTLANGATRYRYIAATLNAGLPNGTVVKADAEVDNGSGTPNSVSDITTVQAPNVTLAPSSLTFGNQRVGTTSTAKDVTVTNTGALPLSISSINASSGFSIAATTCPVNPATLAPDATCTVSVAFAPASPGPQNGTLTINSNAPGSPHTVALSGTGVAPALTLSPTALDFGNQLVGTTSTAQTVTVTNNGTAPLTIGVISLPAGDFTQTENCPVTLNPAATCTLTVRFKPTATGARSDTITITSDAPGSPHSVALTGNGTQPGVDVSPASLTFGNQQVGTTSAAQTVTLTNNGTGPLTISGVSVTGNFARTSNCPPVNTPLAVGASCTISVTFTPSVAGARSGTLTISSNAPGSPHTVSLSGTGIAPSVQFSPTSLTFGGQAIGVTSAAKTVTLTNNGNAPLTISGVAASGDYAQTNDCPATLAEGTFCTISVTLTPTAAGTRNGVLTVTDNAAGSPHTVALSGTGEVPAVTLSSNSLTFGSQLLGTTSAAQDVTLRNTGGAPLTISIIKISGDFAQTNTCPASPATLAPDATCTISVTFTPTAAGTRTGLMTVIDSAVGSPRLVNLSGTGEAPAPVVTFAPASLDFGETAYGATSAPQTLTLTNSGSAELEISAITASGDFAVASTTCPTTPATIAINDSCDISVTFTPTAGGTRSGVLSVAGNLPNSPSTAALSGVGGAPFFSSNPAVGALNLTSLIGASNSLTLKITNGGTEPLDVSKPAETAAAPFSLSLTAAFTLEPGASQEVFITCAPRAAGPYTQQLTYTTNDPSQPTVTYTVTCSGVANSVYQMFAPFVSRPPAEADLIVESFNVTPTTLAAGEPVQITATVKNNGETATGGFWVDLYINPKTAPVAANLPWNETCSTTPCYGIAWYVQGLAPGASIDLTSTEGSFFSKNSNWVGTFAAGTSDVYLYVDSWNRDDKSGSRVPSGAVVEGNESNNRAEVHNLNVSRGAEMRSVNNPQTMPERP